jgi:hypothetical protein
VAGRQSSVSCFYNFHAFTRTIHMPPHSAWSTSGFAATDLLDAIKPGQAAVTWLTRSGTGSNRKGLVLGSASQKPGGLSRVGEKAGACH